MIVLRSPIFRKLLLSIILPGVIALLLMGLYIDHYMRGRQAEDVEQRLETSARILAGEIADPARSPSLEQLGHWAHEAESRAQARVALVNPDGSVLADSESDSESSANLAGAPEVAAARAGRAGTAVHRAAEIDRDFCYLALPVSYLGRPGFVLRLASPLDGTDRAIAAIRLRIFEASLAAAMVALAIAYFFSQSFTRRINNLRSYAESLVKNQPSEGSLWAGQDELGALGRSLKRTSSEIRQLVDRLSLESSRRDAILSSMVEGVLAVDGELRITFCNESFARLVDAPRPVPEGMRLMDLIRDPGFTGILRRVLRTGESAKERLQLPVVEGRWFEVQAAQLATPTPRAPGAIAILHDISDLERLERVRKDFVANVSHELRTPLTAIQGYAETLLDGAIEDKENNRRFVEIIKAHAIRLRNISADLLILSELESGRPPAEPERVAIRPALEAALRAVESEARLREVVVRRGEFEDVFVRGQKVQLEQVLVNLLDNAVKFNRRGGDVAVEVRHIPEGKVAISVADSGIGIPSNDLSRIFERFYRVDKARSRDVGGTGLGLSIVKHVVERMNGTVEVESRLGKGSQFTLKFPAVNSEESG